MATPWLPDSCLTSSNATNQMGRVVDEWAQSWMATSTWHGLGSWDEVTTECPDQYTLLGRAAGMEVKGKPGAKTALGLAILGAQKQIPKTPHDNEFLRDLGSSALDDLITRLDALASPSGVANTQPALGTPPRVFSFLIGTLGHVHIAIECALPNLVQLVRDTYPANPSPSPLEDRIKARNKVHVKIAAQLGTASISLKDLAGLEAGDLLLLDSRPGEPAKLMIEDKPTDLSFLIRSSNDQCLLEFQETR